MSAKIPTDQLVVGDHVNAMCGTGRCAQILQSSKLMRTGEITFISRTVVKIRASSGRRYRCHPDDILNGWRNPMTKAEAFAAKIKQLSNHRKKAATRKIKKRTTILLNLPPIKIPPPRP